MTKKELINLLAYLPNDYNVVVLVKSNITMQIKDIQIVNDNTVMIIPFGLRASDTLLQDFYKENL